MKILQINFLFVILENAKVLVAWKVIREPHCCKKNFKYFQMLLFGAIPNRASSLDSSRMMILMFCVNSIEMMGKTLATAEDRTRVVEWIYSRQSSNGGFDGGSDAGTPAAHAQ